MKREISRKIKAISDEIGTVAAAAEAERIIEDLENEYDARIANGMSELDAYRDILVNIREIEALLRSMPKTDAESSSASRKADMKKLSKQLGTISSVMWLITVAAYILLSFKTGDWHISWLIFLYTSILQTILDMIKAYNSGKTLKNGLSSILWLVCVIVYFLISFSSGAWALTWLIFIAGAIVQVIIDAAAKK